MYVKYIAILFKSQMQYRASFWLLCAGQFFVPFTVFAGVYFMFARFGQVEGWTFSQVALCIGVIGMAYSLGECFVRGFDLFASLVASGDFDRLLVRPRSLVLQVLGSRFEFTRVGRLLQSGIVLVWSMFHLAVEWDGVKLLVLLLMIGCGALIFAGIFILASTLCFWTIQGLEVTNVFTDGGREMAQYPLNLYEKWVTRFFTFIIPFGCVSYLPLQFILGKTSGDSWVYALLPLSGCLFIMPCLWIWHMGVKHYRSTGS